MERKFYTNDFEQLLKENADEFKMSPSKKVWRGIYNDIHPGRRWPSIAMSLIFIFTIILVGHLNVQQSRHPQITVPGVQSKTGLLKNNNAGLANVQGDENLKEIASLNKTTPEENVQQNLLKTGANERAQQPSKPSSDNASFVLISKNKAAQIKNTQSTNVPFAKSNSAGVVDDANNKVVNNVYFPTNNKGLFENDKNVWVNTTTGKQKDLITLAGPTGKINTLIKEAAPLNTISIFPESIVNISPVINIEPEKNIVINQTNTSATIQNRIPAFLHKRIHKNSKLNWGFYASPSVSYRVYSKQGNPADQLLLGYNTYIDNTPLNKSVTHISSLGVEAGTVMKYALSKKLKITAGLQINYSAYTIQANNIHPIIATLILHNQKTGAPYPFTSIAYFGNGPGNIPVNIHNYSIQMGLPVGLEYQFAGNNRIQFSAAASLQPSFVLSDKAYMLSTDKRNYFTEASLVRGWNMGTNIGTFIYFKSNKFKWEIGPQVHYQLLSTYKNEYQVKEHYIDYGIRFGISRLIK